MIQRCIEGKRDWSDMVPLAIFFIRMTTCQSSGFSPFLMKHGWEPVSLLQLLYKGWVQEEVDLTDWVMLNMETVQGIRDKAVVNYNEVSRQRKQVLDKRVVERSFGVDDKVYYRIPGRDTKLSESWEGPFTVSRVLGPLTYEIDVGGRRRKIVDIRFLKEYVERKTLRRVTTVLEDDRADDMLRRRMGR